MSNQAHEPTDEFDYQEKPRARGGELLKGILLLGACGVILFYVYSDYFKFENPPEIQSAVHQLEGDLEVSHLVGAPLKIVGVKKIANDASDPGNTAKYEFDIRGHNGSAHVNTAMSREKLPAKNADPDAAPTAGENNDTSSENATAETWRTTFLKVDFSDGTTKEFELKPKTARPSMAR